jgi:hypothetical protein
LVKPFHKTNKKTAAAHIAAAEKARTMASRRGKRTTRKAKKRAAGRNAGRFACKQVPAAARRAAPAEIVD